MRSLEEIVEQLQYRIETDLATFHGNMPERNSLAWNGYLAGLYEWGVIDLSAYRLLTGILPSISTPDPIEAIFTGR